MVTNIELITRILDDASRVFQDNIRSVTLAEALFVPARGYRSILGTVKHAAGWSHVYRSHAFDRQPRSWQEIAWPRGRRDTVIKSESYWQEIISWFDTAHRLWLEDLARSGEEALDDMRPLHWGATAHLYEIVWMTARHHLYHAGELNQILSICRGEAWEEGEEVEENHISTAGHRVRPPWLDQEAGETSAKNARRQKRTTH